ncbi:zinc knuckle domain containing protein [Babesia bovis T2Bo]|uniref:Zinc knuckle domain containing protein n=1 Tax=Babesia bovis TaxID=5865 RepID=A7AWD1_BABBO|nr:zinc knuckle domain containing protein [Babesia bovis T2Bo]EDO05359.1 zinc knuckle domain containing protein [Babesia bovis T2Bo]|eukprot:XP_001608927.1 zinc knuckle domain containing protein [Babesia bovis T2Bo]
MRSRYNRTLAGCWSSEQIEESLRSRQAELDSDLPKTAARIRYLKRKISKLQKALNDGTPVGGNILPQKPKKPLPRRIKNRQNTDSSSDKTVESSKKPKRVRKTCFKCRKRGHTLRECSAAEVGICFRCGSTDHILRDCQDPDNGTLPFTSCFICKKNGHIASQCPDNDKGIYPNGGCCFFCGSVTHLKAMCPERRKSTSR